MFLIRPLSLDKGFFLKKREKIEGVVFRKSSVYKIVSNSKSVGRKTMSKKHFCGPVLLAFLFGCGAVLTSCNPPQQEDVPAQQVVWTGVEDLELDMGQAKPDLMEGVSATQGEKVLTVVIDEERSDELDTSVAGAFSIYYVAYDGEVPVSEDLHGEVVRTITVSRGTYIDNHDFKTSDTKGWSGNGNGNSAMTWHIDASQEALVVEIAKSGDEYWQNQVEFNGLSVKAHTTYLITIRAKSLTPRNIGASLEVPALGYRCIDRISVNSVGYTMSEEYADYRFYYTASENYDGVKFGIILGRFNELDETENTVLIDSVSITKEAKEANTTGVVFTGDSVVKISSYEDYLALPPVTAADKEGNPLELIKEGAVQGSEYHEDLGKAVFGEMWKYVDENGNLSYFRRQISYAAPAPERLYEYDTLDGNFEYGVKFWIPEENDIVKIEADKTNQLVEISSVKTAPSGEPDWRAQLQQNNNGGILTANHAYKMVVEAKIDNINVRTLRAEFCAGAGNPNAKKDMIFEAADTYQSFETEPFQPSSDITGGHYRVGLLLGEYNQAYHLTVKSIHVVEVEADIPYVRESVYEVMNGDFDLGLKYWAKEENGIISISDLGEGLIKIASTQEDRTGQPDWTAQLQQNGNGGILEAGHTYQALVRAKTSQTAVRTLRLEFCAGAGNPNAKVDLSFSAQDTFEEFQTATFTPTSEVSGTNYRIGLLLGEYSQSYELTVDYIRIVEVI